MTKIPQSLMGGDETFKITAAVRVRMRRLARKHQLEDLQDMSADLDIRDVAGMMKGDQQLVLEPASVPPDRGS